MLAELAKLCHHIEGTAAGLNRMIVILKRRSIDRHNGITNILIEGPVVLEDHMGHFCQILVQEVDQLFRIEVLRECSKSPNIGKEYGQFLSISTEL